MAWKSREEQVYWWLASTELTRAEVESILDTEEDWA